jgi:hypothetical protein
MDPAPSNTLPLHHEASPAVSDPGPVDHQGSQHLAWLLAATQPEAARRYDYVLLLRFTLVNVLAFGLLGAATVHGLTGMALAADRTFLVAVIFLVFLAGLGICTFRVWQTSRELNRVRPFDPLTPSLATEFLAKTRGRSGDSRAILASVLRLKLAQRITVVRQVVNSLVMLGLIGTVVGFIIALSGVDPDKAQDFQAVSPMVSTLIEGMSTALYTTLAGAVLNVWLMVNFHLLAGGTVKLISALVELGEAHAGP